ncbi:MAG: oligosaccharide flippase family protein [Cyanobacteria bacterium P01_G01_bin.38]
MSISPPKRSTRPALASGTVKVFIAEALILPTGLVTAGFLTRTLGAENYGLFTLVSVLIAWIEWTITSMFSRTTVKFIGEADDWQPVATTVLRLYLGVSLGATGLLCLLAAPIAQLLHEPVLTTYLRLFALDIPLFALARAHQYILIGIGAFQARAATSAGRWISRLILILVLVNLGLSVPGAILGSLGASLVELVLGRLFVQPSLFHTSAFPPRNLAGYVLPLFMFALSMRLYDKLDLFMIKILGSTAEQTGWYGAAQNLAFVPSIFALSFSSLLLSTLSRLLREEALSSATQMAQNSLRAVIGMLPFAALAAGAASDIVGLVYGQAFLPSAQLLAILIFGSVALVMISVTTTILTAAGKPDWTFSLTSVMVPMAIVGNWMLVPRFGVLGAASVTLFCAVIGAFITLAAVYRLWKIVPPYQTLLRSAVISGLIYAWTQVWPSPGGWLLLKLCLLSLCIPPLFLLLGEFNVHERTRTFAWLRAAFKGGL